MRETKRNVGMHAESEVSTFLLRPTHRVCSCVGLQQYVECKSLKAI